MVITIHIDRWDVTKILIDSGSQAEILFLPVFDKMVAKLKAPLWLRREMNQTGWGHHFTGVLWHPQEPSH
jgi:hypothetical protein